MQFKYVIAFIVGLCLMMFVHIASGTNAEWGGELLLPALTISLVYIADESERWYNSKKRRDKDVR